MHDCFSKAAKLTTFNFVADIIRVEKCENEIILDSPFQTAEIQQVVDNLLYSTSCGQSLVPIKPMKELCEIGDFLGIFRDALSFVYDTGEVPEIWAAERLISIPKINKPLLPVF